MLEKKIMETLSGRRQRRMKQNERGFVLWKNGHKNLEKKLITICNSNNNLMNNILIHY